MAITEMNFFSGGGVGQTDSGTKTLTANTEETIPLSFEPSEIICVFKYSASDYIVDWYKKDFDDSYQYETLCAGSNGGSKYSIPYTGTGIGGAIQSISSNGFSVKAVNSYKNLEWYAYE